MRTWNFGVFCIVFFLGFMRGFGVQAQEVQLGELYSGEIVTGDEESWSFMAQEGQVVSFWVLASDSFDPILTIRDLNGAALLKNDDYAPQVRDALIEAFTAPYTGSYTLAISGYADSTGIYTLQVLPGYSQTLLHDTFDGGSNWDLRDLGGTEQEAALIAQNGVLELSQEGISETALALSLTPEENPYYFHTTISRVRGTQGWQVGLAFNYVDEENYYVIQVNYLGSWRMVKVEEGIEQSLRDWGVHPAIRPSETEFSLGLLVNAGQYEVFYNEAFIGSERDTSTIPGQIGLIVSTTNAIGSTVTGYFEEVHITSPVYVNDKPIFAEQLIMSSTNYTVRELERRQVIPSGGSMAITLPESFASQIQAGVSRFGIGNERKFKDFVLGATITWPTSSTILNGCGFTVRDTDADLAYLLAYIDSYGGYGISIRYEQEFVENIYYDTPSIGDQPHKVLIIGYGDSIYYFVNGIYAAQMPYPAIAGGISEVVVNFDASSTECTFSNLWVWSLD